MSRPPLRWLMLWPLMATITVGFAAFAVYAERTVSADLIQSVDTELARASVRRAAPPAGGQAPPSPRPEPVVPTETPAVAEAEGVEVPGIFVVDADGNVEVQAGEVPISGREAAGLRGGDGYSTIAGEVRYRALARPGPDDTTSVSTLSLARTDATISKLRRSILVGGLAILAAQAVAVWLITRRVAGPVTRMTEAANRVAAGALDTPIDPPGGSRETAQLAGDLEAMLGRLRTTLADSDQARLEATRARDDMARFLADASHELRTPLTALKGYSDLYAGGMLEDPEDLDRAWRRIGSESERLTRLVGDMLTLARGDATNVGCGDAIEVAELVTGIAHDLAVAYPDHQVTAVVHPAQPPRLAGNRGRLHQALLNLGANACQHTPPGTSVRLEVTTADELVTILAVDDGPGIDPDQADQLFLPFFRADSARGRTGHGGAGLGLTIAHQVAEQHGGTLTQRPTPGGGATFELTLPMPPAPTLRGRQEPMSDTTSNTLHVPDISCEHCVKAITDAVSPLPGVEHLSVDIDAKQVTVTGGNLDTVTTAIVEAGYPVA